MSGDGAGIFPSLERGGSASIEDASRGGVKVAMSLTPTRLAALADLPLSGVGSENGEETRASNATRKPKAAGVAPVSGTISCKAAPDSPPCGKQRSMAVRPNGIGFAVLTPSIFGNKRRNSAATAARLRNTEKSAMAVDSRISHFRFGQRDQVIRLAVPKRQALTICSCFVLMVKRRRPLAGCLQPVDECDSVVRITFELA
jgi:hypothetical protein